METLKPMEMEEKAKEEVRGNIMNGAEIDKKVKNVI